MEGEKLQHLEEVTQGAVVWWLDAWIRHAAFNAPFLISQYGKRVFSISDHPKLFGKPAIITGSGPSLDSFPFDEFKSYRKDFLIFASLSNASVWLRHDIIPDYIGSVDSASFVFNRYLPREIRPFFKDTPLLCPPTIHSDIVRHWPGPLYVFRPIQLGVHFIMDILPKMYTKVIETPDARDRFYQQLFKIGFANAGCITNTLLEVASYLGCEPQFLIGIDFGFPDGKPGCTRYTYEPSESAQNWHWKPDPQPLYSYKSAEEPRLSSNLIWTTSEQLHYKLNFYSIWQATGAFIYNLAHKTVLGNTVPLAGFTETFQDWRELWQHYPIPRDQMSAYIGRLKAAMIADTPPQAESPQPPQGTPLQPPQPAPVKRFARFETPPMSLGTPIIVSTMESLPPEIRTQLQSQQEAQPNA